MRMRWGVMVAILAAGSGAVSRADTIKTFGLTFSSIYEHGDHIHLDGNITVDTTTGTVKSAEVFNDFDPVFDANQITSTGTGTVRAGGGGGGGGGVFREAGQTYIYVNLKDPNNGSYFDLNLDTASLVNYAGGTLCEISGCAFSINKGNHQFDGGTVDSASTRLISTNEPAPDPMPSGPTSVTPEPSSLSLLGLGLAGMAGVVKRRFA